MPSTWAPPSAYPLPGVPSGGGPSLGAPWSGVQPAWVSSAAASADPKHPAALTVTSAVTDANSFRISGVQPKELVLPVLLGAGGAPDLAARRGGNRPGRYQDEISDI